MSSLSKLVLCTALLVGALSAEQQKHFKKQTIGDMWHSALIWTRDYVTSVCGDLPNKHERAKELLAHYEALGTPFSPLYSHEVTTNLQRLLMQLAVDIQALVQAAHSHKSEAVDVHIMALKRTTDELNAVLSRNNPHVAYLALKALFDEYRRALCAMIIAYAEKELQKDTRALKELEQASTALAHYIQDVLEKSFPTTKQYSPGATLHDRKSPAQYRPQ